MDAGIGRSNIDPVRAEIMRLEQADVFDSNAWGRVLVAMADQGRVAGLADAQRRMESARGRQAILIGVDRAQGSDRTVYWSPVSTETAGAYG